MVNGVGNEAGFIGGDVITEELERGGWRRKVVNLGGGGA